MRPGEAAAAESLHVMKWTRLKNIYEQLSPSQVTLKSNFYRDSFEASCLAAVEAQCTASEENTAKQTKHKENICKDSQHNTAITKGPYKVMDLLGCTCSSVHRCVIIHWCRLITVREREQMTCNWTELEDVDDPWGTKWLWLERGPFYDNDRLI